MNFRPPSVRIRDKKGYAFAMILETAVAIGLGAEMSSETACCKARIPDRHSRGGGNPWRKKTQFLHVFTMGPCLRGYGAAASCCVRCESVSTAVSKMILSTACGVFNEAAND